MDLSLLHGVEGLSRVAAGAVVSGLWQGLVLAAAVGVCLRLVPKTTAAIRFAVWTVVFAVLAFMPLWHGYGIPASGAPGHRALVLVDVRWSFAVAALWLMASIVRGVRLARSAVELHGIWRRATPIDAHAGCEIALAAAGWREVTICTSADVDRPSVIGFFSPRILIPQEMLETLSAVELEQIVLHEMGHLRRGDDWMNLLQKISLVLVPLNPALLWIERRLCFERELACDDAVLRLTKAPKAYAICLTSLAEQRLGRRVAALSLGAWERRSELARRVHSILRRSEGMGRGQARVVMGVLVLGLVGGATELARCPQMISFSGGAPPSRVEAQSFATTSAEYQAVAFNPSSVDGTAGIPHETLLKASMPSRTDDLVSRSVKTSAAKRHRSVQGATLMRTKQSRAAMQQAQPMQRWVVLTSFEESATPRMVLTVSSERGFSSSYAAVPTEGGWLVIQL
ncbi:M56 family metallopeptidase [Granulicella sp. S190]|uniref:M56 family metallopeptidase n=1 Tax=Granulicella sp. S190 TaxID=1747226 RepID=UPI00131C6955|nr:M56 family metallopeptidase [Granulicella sp. S190]